MYHITHLSFNNLKGISFASILAPATLIVGPNFSGKSAILDAIRFVLQGYIPELGKTNAATYDLASGLEMSATLKMSDGQHFSRRIWREKGAVKSEGADPQPTPLLDGETYFGLSDAKRIDYVFSRVAMPETFTVAGIVARLQRLTFSSEHTETIEVAKREVIAVCTEVFERESTPGRSGGDAVRAALADLTEITLKDDFTHWNRQAAESLGTVRLLTELKNREGECSAETLTDLENESSRLSGVLAEANQELGELQARSKVARQTAERREVLSALLAAPEPVLVKPTKVDVGLQVVPSAEHIARELSGVLEEIRKITPPDINKARDWAEEASRDWNRVNTALVAAREAVAAKEKELLELGAHDSCPFCKSKAKGWRKKVEQEINDRLDVLKGHLAIATEAESVANEKRELTSRSLEDIKTEFETCRALLDRRDSLARKVEEAEAETERVTEENERQEREAAQAFERAMEKFERAGREWQEARARNQEELSNLELVSAPSLGEVDAAEAWARKLRSDRDDVADKITTAQRLQQDIRRAAQAAEKHHLAVARKEVIGAVGKALKAVKGEMVADAFGSLLATANSLAGEILPSPLEYSEEAGDIGRRDAAGRFVTHRTFSGTEKALAYAAISAALTSQSAFRLVILDELGRLTPDIQERVLQTFEAAVSDGRLHQVIAVIPLPKGEGVPAYSTARNYNIIRTGK